MAGSYKLSSSIYGHTADVRTLASTPDGQFLSGSRDLSAKLWQRDSPSSANFITTASFSGHSNFVASVCYIGPCDGHPQGVIVTGSNDKKIRLFDPSVTSPFQTLSEHTNTICKITPGSFGWTFLSASWDQTARGWREEAGMWISTKFAGHTMAVWAVCQVSSGLVITASADKTLRVFGESGDLQRQLNGHTDCVRDVVAASSEEVLSVSNDATVRLWNILSGDCLNTYYGHAHYIYSIATLPGVGWVTSSEDRTVRVWSASGEAETIMLPCQSVWAVTVLPNSDIVAGSNDGVIRVFTTSTERAADSQAVAAYNKELEKMAATQEIAGVKLSELPGKEGLAKPGNKDGQTKVIRDGKKAIAYTWSANENTWHEVGEVVGGAENAAGETGRPTYNGKEYDMVLNVDTDDNRPALKLPYNRSEDPWMAAQKFIETHDLPQSYLEQVANFIVQNAGTAAPVVAQPEFVDPLTGGSRYVPQSGSANTQSKPSALQARYFPQKEFLRFDQGNATAIKDKLLLLNKDHNCGVDEIKLSTLISKCDSPDDCTVEDLSLLQKLLDWPHDIVFPVLDVLRLVIRSDNVADHFCSQQFLQGLQSHLQNHPNNMLAIRICCNLMSTSAGELMASKHRVTLIQFLLSVPTPYSKVLQTALATLLLNVAVLLRNSNPSNGMEEAFMAGRELLSSLQEEEAIFRCLVGLGTLLNDVPGKVHYIDPIRSVLHKYSASSAGKVRDCANDILALVQL